MPRNDVFVMNADGSDQDQVGGLHGSMPTWSPDGSQIAFISVGYGIHFYGKAILRANVDGSDVRRVARAGAGSRLAYPSRIDWRVR